MFELDVAQSGCRLLIQPDDIDTLEALSGEWI